MQRLETLFYNKAPWGEGPWLSEPDKLQWQDGATGLPCLAVRNSFGAWCGYAGVYASHPLFEKSYDDVYAWEADQDVSIAVHGGLTFSDHCMSESEDGRPVVCHAVDSGEDDNVWWLGFDCMHYGDYAPGMALLPQMEWLHKNDVYRDFEYVKLEVTKLACQLYALGKL